MRRIGETPGGPALGCAALAEDAGLAEAPLVRKLVRLSSPALVQDPRQLPGQVVGRLSRSETAEARRLLEQATAWRNPKGAWMPLQSTLRPADGPLEQILKGHSSGVFSVAWSPDGLRIASGSDD